MKIRSIHAYVYVMVALALMLLPTHDWRGLIALPPEHLTGFAILAAFGVLAESLALTVTVGRSAGNSSIAFLPLLASVILFGPAAGILFMTLTGGIAEFAIRKKKALRASFNVAQYALSTSIAGWAYVLAGGTSMVLTKQPGLNPDFGAQLLPFASFGVVFHMINLTSVSVAVALSEGLPFRQVWRAWAGRSGTNMFYDFLIAPFALLVAFVYLELGVKTGIAVTMLPLLFIWYSYLSNHKLQQANRDLLQVLIKAIETRDPYTSGHSLRVSELARRIARALNLPEKRIESVTTAALLHDIGKIDVAYEEILRKPGDLSVSERSVIESHVTKGVELLASLSSFSSEVIAAVRHHHELYDGTGYPDKLSGDGIPIGGRIIKVCDAIDAMLSDRPYREALTLDDVRLQLQGYSGTQFDPEIVRCVINNAILEEHWEQLHLAQTLNGTGEVEEPAIPRVVVAG